MPLPKHTILDVFPLELLEHIVKTDPSIGNLRQLRLVSKAMKDIVDPLAFSSTTISFSDIEENLRTQLESMASGTSPNSLWTTRLFIQDLVQLDGPESDESVDNYNAVLALQKSKLIPAIAALKEVKCVHFNLSTREPYVEVIAALARLSKLRTLRVSVSEFKGQKVAAFSRISNLEEIQLDSKWSSGFQKAARRLILASLPTLKKLYLEQFPQSNAMELRKLILPENFAESSPPSPLTSLCLFGPNEIAVDQSCARLLRNLTHLDIRNLNVIVAHQFDSNASFWDALSSSNTHLHSLLAYPLTPSLIRYLLSYAGLSSLRIESDHEVIEYIYQPEGVANLAQTLFASVLPRHCATLKRLSLVGLNYRFWALTEATLNEVVSCHALERLDVIYHFPREMQDNLLFASETPFIDMSRLLSRLLNGENLPHLHTIALAPARKLDNAFGKAVINVKDSQAFLAAWQRLVCQVDLTRLSHSKVLRNPHLKLYVASSGANEGVDPDFAFDIESGHFAVDPAQDWNES
ncbi:hypothetical protein D9611_013927 [Ephemerocybe angulata]|uniref:F-box domain-containing protein n=1 Tax=Ephemerocybe angulata TaxID=980116 RepID=A0A8H5B855_9AGAR|nr:hypothetical protein D9611_013927 [Tulosesus angulatus]